MGALTLTNGTLLLLAPGASGATTPVLSPYAARGITQTYELLNSGQGSGVSLRRDINGILQNISDTRFRKFKTTITCRDGDAPSLDGAWIGNLVEIWCAFELNYPAGGSPSRPVVAGSSRTQGGVTFYRPALSCLITDIRDEFAEYAATHSWTLSAEEQ